MLCKCVTSHINNVCDITKEYCLTSAELKQPSLPRPCPSPRFFFPKTTFQNQKLPDRSIWKAHSRHLSHTSNFLEPQKQNNLACSSCRFLHNAPEEPSLGPWAKAVFHSWRLVIDNIFLPPSSRFHWGDATADTSHACKIPCYTI